MANPFGAMGRVAKVLDTDDVDRMKWVRGVGLR
jgi:hypothetical protein